MHFSIIYDKIFILKIPIKFEAPLKSVNLLTLTLGLAADRRMVHNFTQRYDADFRADDTATPAEPVPAVRQTYEQFTGQVHTLPKQSVLQHNTRYS